MTNKDILSIALEQSAIDAGCSSLDFMRKENIIVESKPHPSARRYLELPLFCNLISYGRNVVVSCHREFMPYVKDYIDTYTTPHLFETPNLHVLDEKLASFGMQTCFMAEYFLPDVDLKITPRYDGELRVLSHDDFSGLYTPEWSNALSSARPQLDVIGVGAYEDGRLIGLAGASADCDTMWQIGIDVLPEYRFRGIASTLVSRLKDEILSRGIVPFYCAAWSNIASVRCALDAGFRPAWGELTAKSIEFVTKMNSN